MIREKRKQGECTREEGGPRGTWVAQLVKRLPWAQVMIPGSLLSGESASPSALPPVFMLSHPFSQISK